MTLFVFGVCVTWLIFWRDSHETDCAEDQTCEDRHVFVWHDSFFFWTCVTWLIFWRDSHEADCAEDQVCADHHGYVWHDSFFCFTCVTWLSSISDVTNCRCTMTHLHMWLDSHVATSFSRRSWVMCGSLYICVTWLTDSFACVTHHWTFTRKRHSYVWVKSHMQMSPGTPKHLSRHS